VFRDFKKKKSEKEKGKNLVLISQLENKAV